MINTLFFDEVKRLNPRNINEIKNAMKETLQKVILSGFGKTDFFKYAVFYGGTSLRIFRDLTRFSDGLDFMLIKEISGFDFDKYISLAKIELDSLLIDYNIYNKDKNVDSTVLSRYFRFNMKHLFEISYKEYANQIINNEVLSIKVEIETKCFSGGETEFKLLTYPSLSQIRIFKIETLFASKLIAVLNRGWKNRIKGRDFYDYLFYIYKGAKINKDFLISGLKRFGYLEKDELTIIELKELLFDRFNSIDFEEAKKDIIPFIFGNDILFNSFNKDIFISSIDLIEYC
ncbi:MAG: nucleotidyl transferase AbiEii/AbiGii toxin family protein [Bacilli bacterium]|nr:nucleotidyl transferase AbiEii/AbiGii toxin family protein [Bacilli bacterium]